MGGKILVATSKCSGIWKTVSPSSTVVSSAYASFDGRRFVMQIRQNIQLKW
jgi:hypothetical protein